MMEIGILCCISDTECQQLTQKNKQNTVKVKLVMSGDQILPCLQLLSGKMYNILTISGSNDAI